MLVSGAGRLRLWIGLSTLALALVLSISFATSSTLAGVPTGSLAAPPASPANSPGLVGRPTMPLHGKNSLSMMPNISKPFAKLANFDASMKSVSASRDSHRDSAPAAPVLVAQPTNRGSNPPHNPAGPDTKTHAMAPYSLSTEHLSGTLTPADLANSLMGAGVSISNVTYRGADIAAGRFTGGTGIIGFDSGVILSSGDIANVIGPNTATNITADNGQPGDVALSAISGFPTYDASVIEFDFVPLANTISFDYVFSSDEYNEYVNSTVNDVFAFFVNGTNCAVLGNGDPVTINTINLGRNANFYRNNDFHPTSPIDTQMDGLTTVLACQAVVTPGVTNHMKLAIADASDRIYDSNVFIHTGNFTPSQCPAIQPGNPPSLVAILLHGTNASLDVNADYYPVQVQAPGSYPTVSTYCSAHASEDPQAVRDLIDPNPNADPDHSLFQAPPGGESLTDLLAEQGAVLLPFGYKGAQFLGSDQNAPLFHVNRYTKDDTNNAPLCDAEQALTDEVNSVRSMWPGAEIVLIGHSRGGLVAELSWEGPLDSGLPEYCHAYPPHPLFDFEGVSHIFTLDAPINGLERERVLFYSPGGDKENAYTRLWNAKSWRDGIIAANSHSVLHTIGTDGDMVYYLGDQHLNPGSAGHNLWSQIIVHCDDFPQCQQYSIYTPPLDRVSSESCWYSSPSWVGDLESHGFVLKCADVNDYIMSTIGFGASPGGPRLTKRPVASQAPGQEGSPHVPPASPTATPSAPSGRMDPQVVSPGQAATISGQGFGASAGQVQFVAAGEVFAFAGITSWADTQINVTVPMTATTGPVFVSVPSYYRPVIVAGATVLNPGNGVATISVTQGAPALWGQPLTITLTTRDGAGQPLPNKPVAVSDGITETVRQTGPAGTALFPITGTNPQDFVVHSGSVYTSTTLTWQRPPTMTLAMSVSDVEPSDGEPITVSATLRDEAGQPVPNQPVFFRTIGSDNLQLTAAEAWTDSSGIATTGVTNTGSEHFLVGAVADDYSASADISIRPIVVPSLVGHVNWQGRPSQPNSLQQLPITLTLKIGSAGINYLTKTTDPSGFFTVSVGSLTNGTYNWRVKGPKFLANSGNIALTGTLTTNLDMGQMRAGDANNDNCVTSLDFNIVKVSFAKAPGDPGYDPRADFTGDNRVDIADFNLLKINFGICGQLFNTPTPTYTPSATATPTMTLTRTPTISPTSSWTPTPVIACPMFPSNNIWNYNISALPTHVLSNNYISSISSTAPLHADFGSGTYNNGPIGMPYISVPGTQPRVPITFTYALDSDPGPYPIPTDAPIEGGPNSTGSRHVIVVDRGACVLYEMYNSYPQPDGSWRAGAGALWDLNLNNLRPAGWTSADAAGLPILPALVKYDEVAAGAIHHALRFSAPNIQASYIWPARHPSPDSTATPSPNLPPRGLRVRLKASVDISSYPAPVRVILQGLKDYGMFLADTGDPWEISGVPDERWDNDILQELGNIQGSDFEAVDESGLMMDPNSGQARDTPTPSPTPSR